ncbi:MAG: hypothetical protein AVDCRST_MAG73-2178 [uncultured Thermomicrobiales bacterium]|uniref:Uncharacterized protein n=1 Tax=uncultured Thermomicrobiales bacterium TaxID=1645740 RepID=A0A6J4UAX9_9BACT|nr:MAG: hypothetical protein AVDCRST_MAG73-2178 [uncultured Thermomicrobiales bacterium]
MPAPCLSVLARRGRCADDPPNRHGPNDTPHRAGGHSPKVEVWRAMPDRRGDRG